MGQPSAPAPGPAVALVSTQSDWTDLREVITHKPVTGEDLAVPATGIQLGIQVRLRTGVQTEALGAAPHTAGVVS